MTTITLTLANGQTFIKHYDRQPKFWRSAALRLAPYGADLTASRSTLQTH